MVATGGGTKKVAAVVNAEKSMIVAELWKPHLGTLPLFEDLGLEECHIPTLTTFFLHCWPAMLLHHGHSVHPRRGQIRAACIHQEAQPYQPRGATVPER